MASLADYLRKIKDQIAKTASTAASNVKGNIEALSNKDTRSDYVRGVLATPVKFKGADTVNRFVERTEPLIKSPAKTIYNTPVSGPAVDILSKALSSAPARFTKSALNTVTEAPVKVITSVPRAIKTAVDQPSATDQFTRDRWTSDTMFNQAREATKRGDFETSRKLSEMAGETGRQAGDLQIKRGEDILEQMKKLGAASFRTLLLAAAGKANPRDIILSGGVGTGIGAGYAALEGSDVAEGAGEGLGSSVKFAGLNKVSSKLLPGIEKIKYLPTRAAVRAGQNLAEDVTYAKLGENRDLTPKEIIYSTLLGAGFETGGSFLSKIGKNDIEPPKKTAGGYRVNSAGRLFDPSSGHWVAKEDKAAYSAARKAQDRIKAAGGEDSFWLESDELVKLPGQDRWVPKRKIDEYKSDIETPKLAVEDSPASQNVVSPEIRDYVKTKVTDQKAAEGVKPGIFEGLRNFGKSFKEAVVDQTSRIEDTLTKAEKEYGFKVLPTEDIRFQIDKAIRSDTLATQFIKDTGMDQVIKDVPDLDEFSQYLIAKHAGTVAGKDIETGRDLAKDKQLIKELGPIYEPYAAKIRDFTTQLLDYNVKTGLISADLAKSLRKEYPDYVPLQRIFEEGELPGGDGVGGGFASVGTQQVVKRLKGSEREIKNPLESLMVSASIAFKQGERNKAARQLISYKDLPGNPFDLRQLGADEPIGNKHTISAFIDGKKVVYETTKEIEEAAKGLNREQMNTLMKVLSLPTRLLQLGAVGFNIPFVAGNLVKDQSTAAIISSRPMATSLANPVNFIRAIYQTIGQGKVYDDWVRSGASFTSFDIARDQVGPQLARLRSQRSLGSRVAYTAKNPTELLRTVEDLIGKAEEVTRIQNFEGMRQSLLKEGRTAADAELLAAQASRNNSANFGRKGTWGSVLNGLIPFFNAGVQGARSLVRAVQENPKGAAVRFATIIGMPVMTATAWNMADPERRKAYEDIPEYEKEGNLIILPEKPTQDEQGRWNAIKIPMTPGVGNLASIVRRQIEGTQNVKDVTGDILTATTSVNPLDAKQFFSQITPQALKPGIEAVTNTNLFTGLPIVPEYMKNLPPEEQIKKNTSLTARALGKATGASPLMIDNTVKTAGAGVGQQLLGVTDKIVGGITGDEPVAGRTVVGDLKRRFTSAAGGEQESRYYDFKDKKTGEISAVKNMLKNDKLDLSQVDPTSAAEGIYQSIAQLPQKERARAYDYIADKLPDEVKAEIAAIKKYEDKGLGAPDRLLLSYPPELRAKATVERIMDLDAKNRAKKYDDLVRAGVITAEMKPLIARLVKEASK